MFASLVSAHCNVSYHLSGHEAEIKDVALVSGSADYTAKIWKVNAEGKVCCQVVLEERKHVLMRIAFDSGSTRLHWKAIQAPSKRLLVCAHSPLRERQTPSLQVHLTALSVSGSVV